eukprot:1142050-Pelagomonas_calceolata.AAC.3
MQVKEALLKNIKRRMTPQPLKIRADVELTCFQYDGIEHIRSAMRAAEAASKDGTVAAEKDVSDTNVLVELVDGTWAFALQRLAAQARLSRSVRSGRGSDALRRIVASVSTHAVPASVTGRHHKLNDL